MSEACGCGNDERDDEHEPERLWEITELRAAAVAGVVLLTGYVVGWTGGPRPVEIGLYGLALAIGAWTFVPSTLRRLAKGQIGVGTLMTIAAVGAVILGEVGEAAMLAFLFSISEGLEEYSLARTRRGLRALLSLVPDEATVLRDGAETTIPASELRVGDRMLVRPGERVATDGTITSGRTALDVSAITGESVPVEAGPVVRCSPGRSTAPAPWRSRSPAAPRITRWPALWPSWRPSSPEKVKPSAWLTASPNPWSRRS